jgi:hypothetical protein
LTRSRPVARSPSGNTGITPGDRGRKTTVVRSQIVGIVLIVIGIGALADGGFSFTSREKVAEIGPIKIEKEKTQTLPLPVLGGLALVGGIVLLIAGARHP